MDLNTLYAQCEDSWDNGMMRAVMRQPVVTRGSPNQPRDDHGRFSTTGGQSVKDYLKLVSDAHGEQKPAGFKYNSVEQLVLHEGKEWEPGKLPKDVKPMKLGMCFMNAYQLVDAHPKEYRYVEGFATVSDIPIAHAWAVDKNDKVVDPTWAGKNALKGETPVYYGVEIPIETARATVIAREKYGILHNPEQGFPLLRTGLK